jgi:hypothetical protein
MRQVADTDALILDVRAQGGGFAPMERLFVSYFFGETPVHLEDIYSRPDNRTESFWTVAVAGQRYVDRLGEDF